MGGRRCGTVWLGGFVLAVPLLAAGLTGAAASTGPVAGRVAGRVDGPVAGPAAGPIGGLTLGPLASVGIDTTDRAAVRSALVKKLRPALAIPIGWTGSTATCAAGKPSAQAQAATLSAINYFRAMGRLDPVTLDPAMSAQAQQAALMMDANFALDHSPPSSWHCWTQTGADAAGQSNLCLGCTGAEAVSVYMSDPGQNNGVAGHRRWVMYPQTSVMGSGSTRSANALMVFGSGAPLSATRPRWVSWPTPGYFPTELEPGGRWSLSGSDASVDFGAAKVSVSTATGAKLKVKQEAVVDGYGSNTLVWQVSGLKLPTGTTPRRIDVAVTGIHQGATVVSRRYPVRLFNADARLANTKAPILSGTPAVGQVLGVKHGTWSPVATSFGYVWYRGSTQIAGALEARYTLTSADAGAKISVKVIARRAGYASGSKYTPARSVTP
jgi:uncharacterized protein YkwD